MSLFSDLSAAASEADLRFLVVGGHAVNAMGYARVTVDLDLLVCKEEREAWATLVGRLGYSLFHDGTTFLQLTPPAALAAWPLDLMFVSRATFEQLWAAATRVEMEGTTVAIPAVSHLIAMKLHALKTGGPERQGRDFQDIVGLIRVGRLDIAGPDLRRLFDKYGTPEWYERAVIAVDAGT